MATTPPSASVFLQKHTHHSANEDDEAASSVSHGATEMVSNLIEGIVGGAGATGDDDASMSSMKHRKESFKSYDQRLPKTYKKEGGGGTPPTPPGSVPYKGFGTPSDSGAPARPGPLAGLKHRFRGLFSPRATDIQQLLIKLKKQFETLEFEHRKYVLFTDGSRWDEDPRANRNITTSENERKDPNHPLNNPKLITEVHFVGRKAMNPSIVELSSLLAYHDRFGSITELWLNNNLISDDGADAIAAYLELPTCSLTELWLGNNQIGPAGTTLISAALSNNSNSQLKCLGLYLNPIGNGGASSLAQMLRGNHSLSTLDIHGCGRRNKGPVVLEGYGCKVVTASDGTEYVARVVAQNQEEEEGVVTDQRLLDAIQTFVAFNRISPTREKVIRGMMSSDMPMNEEGVSEKLVSKCLSELSNQPANEELTDNEKQMWKDCEWERLHIELERSRAAKKALASRLEVNIKENEEDEGLINSGGNTDEQMTSRDLDEEVVQTDSRSFRDIKNGITGSAGGASLATPNKNNNLFVISDVEHETDDGEKEAELPPPQTSFV